MGARRPEKKPRRAAGAISEAYDEMVPSIHPTATYEMVRPAMNVLKFPDASWTKGHSAY
jgi:hypothetical protein